MTVVVPCHKGDQHQAERLLKWIAELGQVEARCVLFCAKDCNHPYLLSLAQCAFSEGLWLEDRENIKSNWSDKTAGATSAAGPNSLFRQIAWYFYLPAKGPWLFLEPDCIPCTRDWYYKLRAEYEQVALPNRKPFMGFRVDPKTHPGSLPVPIHMSGVGIYPSATPQLCPDAVRVSEAAFDVVGAKQMVPLMHNTTLLRHHYCAPSINSMEEADVRVPPGVVLYHANKCGTLIPWLRQRLGMESKEETVPSAIVPAVVPPKLEMSAPMTGKTVDIFIRTYEHDFDFLRYCLKSISKFATGFRRVIIHTPDGLPGDMPIPNGTLVIADKENKKPGYHWQQAMKLMADTFTDADYILTLDSDCVFTKPVTPQDFMRGGRPYWLMTPWGDAREDQQVWRPVMEKFVGKTSPGEMMRRHPEMLPRAAYEKLREFCRYKHGMEICDYVMAQQPDGKELMLTFSEWNCMGFFLYEFHHNMMTWIDTTKDSVPDAVVWQAFTHGGEKRKQEDIAKFREILETDNAGQTKANISRIEHNLSVDGAIAFLVEEARRDQFAKGRILKRLKAAGMVKGGRLPPKMHHGKYDHTNQAPVPIKEGVLLAIQTYPGGNDTMERHWPFYYLSGATRIVGIGTTDNKCKWPVDCEHVNIGKNSYINGPHLPQRLVDTLEWCVKQPEDRYIIAEYDVLFLGAVPPWTGAMLHRTGGRPHDAKASQFFHNPWCVDRDTAKRLIVELKEIIREGHCKDRWPEASPDVALGFAVDRLKLDYTPMEHMFTRNSLEEPGALELAVEAVRNGATILHGCKTQHAFDCLTAAHKGMKRRKAA